jgi:putative transposase
MAGLVGVSRRRFVITTKRWTAQDAAPNLVKRNFTAEQAVGGRNYLRAAWAGFLYLAIALDAFSRRIVGWAMATKLKTEPVMDPSRWR